METSFGIRWFDFTPERGFFLNGEHVQLRGMCIHHDFGGLGVALPPRAHEKNVEVMKSMGCNILRSAHNAAAPSLMEACDRLGMLFIAEHRYLLHGKRGLPALEELIMRDRNHPSIIAWSLGNTAGDPSGTITDKLRFVHNQTKKLDPSRPTMVCLEGNADANKNGFAMVTDIVGYNGGGMGIDDRDHKLFPERKMWISEYSSGRGTRGVYHASIPKEYEVLGDGRKVRCDGKYESIYELCRAHEREWAHIAQRPWLAGGAMWSGIEYRGETVGWPIVTSQFGVLDICRFPKDTYYYYLQEWTETPMVHIFPHWSWPGREGKSIDIWCYSNCHEVELFLNGNSLGKKTTEPLTHISWQVPYEPGTLDAKGYIDGKLAASKRVATAGEPKKIRLTADRTILVADGEDLSFITAEVLDDANNLVPTANLSLTFNVQGKGKLLGLSSGNPACHKNEKGKEIASFMGLCLAIVQSSMEPGSIIITANSVDLKSAVLKLNFEQE